MQPFAATVLCEWDRENILRYVPSSIWMGKDWNNSGWQGPWLDEAADILNSGFELIEMAIHGVGHEYWDAEVLSRAEWHDTEGVMRPKDEVIAHLECFYAILYQNRLLFRPESFCPAAFMYNFGLENGMSTILKDYGIKYISTSFRHLFRSRASRQFYLKVEGEEKIKSVSNNLRVISNSKNSDSSYRLLKISRKNNDKAYGYIYFE